MILNKEDILRIILKCCIYFWNESQTRALEWPGGSRPGGKNANTNIQGLRLFLSLSSLPNTCSKNDYEDVLTSIKEHIRQLFKIIYKP